MKVEVGDWVKLRGMRRIYEVEKVEPTKEFQGRPFTTLWLVGNKAPQLAEHVERVAAKFWIKKAGDE